MPRKSPCGASTLPWLSSLASCVSKGRACKGSRLSVALLLSADRIKKHRARIYGEGLSTHHLNSVPTRDRHPLFHDSVDAPQGHPRGMKMTASFLFVWRRCHQPDEPGTQWTHGCPLGTQSAVLCHPTAVGGLYNQPLIFIFRAVVQGGHTTVHPWGGYYGATGHETGRLRTDIGAVCSTIRINSGTGPFTMKLERRYERHTCETTGMRARGCDCARPRDADAGNWTEIRQLRYRPRTSTVVQG